MQVSAQHIKYSDVRPEARLRLQTAGIEKIHHQVRVVFDDEPMRIIVQIQCHELFYTHH